MDFVYFDWWKSFVAVDGSKAGSGNLEILVNGGHVTSFVRALGSQKFLASFVPYEAVAHLVEMTFNGDAVPGMLFVSLTPPWEFAVWNFYWQLKKKKKLN